MKKFLIPVLAILLALIVAVPVAAASNMTANLVIDGRDSAAVAGTVDVAYDDAGTITVTYTVDPAANDGWVLSEAQVYVDTKAPSKSAPGRFPYRAVPSADPTVWTCTVSLTPEAGQAIYVAAHAALTKTVVTPNPDPLLPDIITVIEETGWAQVGLGNDIPIPPGKNWATYFVWTPVVSEDGGGGGG
jgi:hypothetical protein